jgi:hypothetical protein
MQRAIAPANTVAEVHQLRELIEVAGPDGGGYANDVLRHHSACPKVQVAYLTVAHLAAGQANGFAGCLEQCERSLADETIPDRSPAEGYGVSVGLGSVSPSVQHDQDGWSGPPSGSL